MTRRPEAEPKISKQWVRLPYVTRISASGWTGRQLYSYAERVAADHGFQVIIEYPSSTQDKFGYPGSHDAGVITFSKGVTRDPAETRKRRARALGWLGVGTISTVVGFVLVLNLPHPLNLVGLPLLSPGVVTWGNAITGGLQAMYRGSFMALLLKLPSGQKPPIRTMSVPITPARLAVVGGRTLTLGPPGSFFSKVRASSKDPDCESAISELAAGVAGQTPLPSKMVP